MIETIIGLVVTLGVGILLGAVVMNIPKKKQIRILRKQLKYRDSIIREVLRG